MAVLSNTAQELDQLIQKIKTLKGKSASNELSEVNQVHISKIRLSQRPKKRHVLVWFSIGLVLTFIIIILGLYFTSSNFLLGPTQDATKETNPVLSDEWKEYKNSDLGFKIKIPTSWANSQTTKLLSGAEVNFDEKLKITATSIIDSSSDGEEIINDLINEKFGNRDFKLHNYTIGDKAGKIAFAKTGNDYLETYIVFINDNAKKEIITISYVLNPRNNNDYLTIDYILSSLELTKTISL